MWKPLPLTSEQGKIKRRMDKIFSDIIRTRDNWECVKCHKSFREISKQRLHCSHYFTKGSNPGLRYNENNADSLCFSDHQRHGDNKGAWYREFKINQLGEKGFKYLEIQAKSEYHISVSELLLLEKALKQRLLELQKLLLE